jgi:predicted hydrocarbon binding protein
LVKNSSKVLGADANVVLEAFGEYWVLYTVNEGYGDMMNLAGNTLPEFLNNLDMLHNRLNNIMPHLVAPQFSTRNETSNSIELEYRSQREGMQPMVVGLLKGLGKRFNLENYTVNQVELKSENKECDVFRINWN